MNRIIDEACQYKLCLILYMNDDLKLDVVKFTVYLFRKYIMYANLAYNM